MKMPRLRFSILAMLVLIAIVSVGLAYWQQKLAWEAAQEKFTEIVVEGKDNYPTPQQVEAVERLIRNYPELAQRDGAIIWAARYGNAELVRQMLAGGADSETRTTHQATSIKQVTVLHLAAINANLAMCQALVEHGADLAAIYEGDNTALHAAVIGGDPDIVRLLLDHDALMVPNGGTFYPREIAISLRKRYEDGSDEANDYDEIIQLLAKHTPDETKTESSVPSASKEKD